MMAAVFVLCESAIYTLVFGVLLAFSNHKINERKEAGCFCKVDDFRSQKVDNREFISQP
jgi:hypothetical protein